MSDCRLYPASALRETSEHLIGVDGWISIQNNILTPLLKGIAAGRGGQVVQGHGTGELMCAPACKL